MKRLLLLFAFPLLLYLSSCDNALAPVKNKPVNGKISYGNMSMVRAKTSGVPTEVQKNYRLDAETITAIRINKKDSTQINLPSALIDMIYNGLIHIYNSNEEHANEVSHQYKIHRAVKAGAARKMFLIVDTTQAYANAWVEGTLKTGNVGIDVLLKKYHFELIDNTHKIRHILAEFRSEKPYNQFAIAKLFDRRDDVKGAGANINFVDGDNIEIDITKDHIHYQFSEGFGDCPSGCIGRHYWTFNVFSDGKVKFEKEYGSSLSK